MDNKIKKLRGMRVISLLCTNLLGTIGYISNVYTKEEFRNKGIQKELMAKCMDFIKKKMQ